MSTEAVEITWLEGVDLENSPPCECQIRIGGEWVACPNFTSVRIWYSCSCGYSNFCFCCKSCYEAIRRYHGVVCNACGADANDIKEA